ncbi:MAG: hypothetical protein LBU16_00825 [Treponema sp.]|jgi:hypothetical protein|nr:hypothetical protein [Treponema sp.]
MKHFSQDDPKGFGPGGWEDAPAMLDRLEEAAKRKDLPFVISSLELVRNAIEREIL